MAILFSQVNIADAADLNPSGTNTSQVVLSDETNMSNDEASTESTVSDEINGTMESESKISEETNENSKNNESESSDENVKAESTDNIDAYYKDSKICITIRADAVYELGNMALLQGSLNSSISDYEFTRKIDGDPNGKMKKKDGIRKFAMLTTTRDVVSTYDEKGVWNEFEIRERTKKFMKSIIDVWPVDIV